MLNVSQFIADHITGRQKSMFAADIEANRDKLRAEIEGKRVLVIGGAGTIGSSYIRAVLPFRPSKLVVVDISENGLAELTRDLRSTYGMYVPEEYRTYPLSFADPVFEKIFRAEQGFDIVANFSAHKHVRSEKDKYSVQALLENNVLKARKLLDLLSEYPPRHFFCVSTDKAANPVNIMGASKKIMEEMIMAYSSRFKISTARFANVAFSNGSLLAGFIDRLMKRQPLSSPNDVKRYFVSPEESGQICMLACILGQNREIFFPKLGEEQMLTFSSICDKCISSCSCFFFISTSDDNFSGIRYIVKSKDLYRCRRTCFFDSSSLVIHHGSYFTKCRTCCDWISDTECSLLNQDICNGTSSLIQFCFQYKTSCTAVWIGF